MAYKECDLFREKKLCPETGTTTCMGMDGECKLKRSVRNLVLVVLGFMILRTFVKTKK